MKVINLFGEPASTKSTTAAGLFALMKRHEYDVELVTEFAKGCVWEDRPRTLDDQLYVSAKQNHQLERLRSKVRYAISDSPLLLGILYSRCSVRFPSFHQLLSEVFFSYENFNILLTRVGRYQQSGRVQTEAEAKIKRDQLIEILDQYKVNYVTMVGDERAPMKIFEYLKDPTVWCQPKY